MYTLYSSKGSSSLAPHLLLEEVGVPYTVVETSIQQGAHQTPEYLALNPKGRVPLLDTPEGGLTENPAILEYIATMTPEAGMLPQGVMAQSRARELCAYICATGHIAFAHKLRGKRWADDPVALEDMQKYVPRNMADCATYLQNILPSGLWALGNDFSYCDPYLHIFTRWMGLAGVSLEPYPKLAAHHAAMMARPATQAVYSAQGL